MLINLAVNPLGPEGIRNLIAGITSSCSISYLNLSLLKRQLHDRAKRFRIFKRNY